MFPRAPIFTALYHPDATFEEFASADVRPSRLQRLSRDPTSFRKLLPLFGRAFRRIDLSGFDLVVSSSAGFAHHVRPRSGVCHVVYCHTPPRFLWDERYEHRTLAPAWARPLLPAVLSRLRRSDRRAAARAHVYVANSRVTAARIETVYARRSVVVPPPVEVERFSTGAPADHFLMVGRLLPHRDMDLAVRAFTSMGRKLVIVGDGPARADLERVAGDTIEFRGVVSDEELAALYASCRALVVPGVEDFGIAPLEANAAGRPVIARAAGGTLETVRDGDTGVLFERDTPAGIVEAVRRLEVIDFDAAELRAHAERYGEPAFARRLHDVIHNAVASCLECRRARRERVGELAVTASES